MSKGPITGGAKPGFQLSEVGQPMGPGGAITTSLSMLKDALTICTVLSGMFSTLDETVEIYCYITDL